MPPRYLAVQRLRQRGDQAVQHRLIPGTGGEGVHERLPARVEDRADSMLLRREVAVERAQGDSGRAGNLLHGDLGEAALSEQVDGSAGYLQQRLLLAPFTQRHDRFWHAGSLCLFDVMR